MITVIAESLIVGRRYKVWIEDCCGALVFEFANITGYSEIEEIV